VCVVLTLTLSRQVLFHLIHASPCSFRHLLDRFWVLSALGQPGPWSYYLHLPLRPPPLEWLGLQACTTIQGPQSYLLMLAFSNLIYLAHVRVWPQAFGVNKRNALFNIKSLEASMSWCSRLSAGTSHGCPGEAPALFGSCVGTGGAQGLHWVCVGLGMARACVCHAMSSWVKASSIGDPGLIWNVC
jgi:hypothetical protein